MTMTALDLSLNNEKLRKYLDDKTNEIPLDEFKGLFGLKSKSGTFLEVLDNELTRVTFTAQQMGKRVHIDSITEQLMVIARCHVAYREGEDPDAYAPLLASAFKTLWLTCKRISQRIDQAKKRGGGPS